MAKFLFHDFDIIKLLVKDEQPSGGAAVQSLIWIQGLQHYGHQVTLVKDNDDTRELKSKWRHLRIVPIYSSAKGIKWIRWVYYRLPRLFSSLREERPDYVYESNPAWNTFFTAIFCKILSIKLIIRIPLDAQLDERYRKDHSMIHIFFMNLGIGLADSVLCQNAYQMGLVKKKFPRKKSLKVYNPFIFSDTKSEIELEKKNYIAWVANFRYQKNLKLLFEIASTLTSYEFRVVGGTASMKDAESAEYLDKLKRLPNVLIVGFMPREDIMEFIGTARFLLNTSRYEGFSNVFLEAMYMGTPILSTERVNPDNVISNHDLGIIYSDAANLEIQLKSISEIGYLRMSENCKLFVKQNHDHLILTRKILKFLQG